MMLFWLHMATLGHTEIATCILEAISSNVRLISLLASNGSLLILLSHRDFCMSLVIWEKRQNHNSSRLRPIVT